MRCAQEIETWVAALGRYDNNEFDEALNEFERISDTSKILFNMGVIHATLGEHEKAVSAAHQTRLPCQGHTSGIAFMHCRTSILTVITRSNVTNEQPD